VGDGYGSSVWTHTVGANADTAEEDIKRAVVASELNFMVL
jgi:hypothetical protein